ncbi:MAG: asparaginase domain-containing protein [Pseudomonadota bacterium]
MTGLPLDLRILVTGGTLDKVHDARTEGLAFREDGGSHLARMLEEARGPEVAVEILFLKDSLDIDEADRARITDAIAAAPERSILLTHGTSTMGRTARHLAERAGRFPDKTVVLTGAMRPFSLADSDASFNLGAAILAAQILDPGVWGVMNGRAFPAAALEKNEEAGRFDL